MKLANNSRFDTSSQKVLVVVPVYNEEIRIASLLDLYLDYFSNTSLDYSLVFADGKSTDQTVQALEEFHKANPDLNISTYQTGVRGKGSQVKKTFENFEGDYKIFMDLDLATPLSYLDNIVDRLKDNPVVIGVRNSKHSKSLIRYAISRCGSLWVRLLLLPDIKDSQCGFKGFQQEPAGKIFNKVKIAGWGFDFEVLALARVMNYRVDQLAIPDWHEDLAGSKFSIIKIIKASSYIFFEVVLVKYRLIFKKY